MRTCVRVADQLAAEKSNFNFVADRSTLCPRYNSLKLPDDIPKGFENSPDVIVLNVCMNIGNINAVIL